MRVLQNQGPCFAAGSALDDLLLLASPAPWMRVLLLVDTIVAQMY